MRSARLTLWLTGAVAVAAAALAAFVTMGPQRADSAPSTPSPAAAATPGSATAPRGAAAPSDCPTKSVATDPRRSRGARLDFAWPTLLEARPGFEVESSCLRLVGLEGYSRIHARRGSLVSVNDGPFVPGPVRIAEGDRVRLRVHAPREADGQVVENLVFDGEHLLGTVTVRSRNADRPPRVFRVGEAREYRQLHQVAPQLVAGDRVEVDSGTYEPVEFRRAGTLAEPITVIGVGPTRPVIAGGKRALQINGAHRMVLQNLEIQGSSDICVRSMAHGVVLRDVYIHDCKRHGLLGADLDSGDLTLDGVEIARAGDLPPGENSKHAAYVATDRDRFPGATLRVVHSYFHDFKGSAIKSRAARSEIYYNWIESPDDERTYYAIELYGFEHYLTDAPLDSDVVGNVIVLHGRYGLRLGGDGAGTSAGHVRLANNTVLLGQKLDGQPVIRLYQQLDSLYLLNNAFIALSGRAVAPRLVRDDLYQDNGWVSGRMKIAGLRNYFHPDLRLDDAYAGQLAASVRDRAVTLADLSASRPDASVPTLSVLQGTGRALTSSLAGYDIVDPLLRLDWMAPSSAPTSGARLPRRARLDGHSSINIGAL